MAGRRAAQAAINGACRRGAVVRAARRHRATGRFGQRPSGAPGIPDAWCAWGARLQRVGAHGEPHAGRKQEGEEERKEKGEKEKGEKEKRAKNGGGAVIFWYHSRLDKLQCPAPLPVQIL